LANLATILAASGRVSFRIAQSRRSRRCHSLATAVLSAMTALTLANAAAAEPPPWVQSARAPAQTQIAYRIPSALKDGRCRPEMFNAKKATGLVNAAHRELSKARRKTDDRRSAPMDGTALGALMAAVTGKANGTRLSQREAACFSQSFEHIPDRKTIAWSDKKLAVYYSIMPMRTLRTSDGHYCREYSASATVNGHAADVYGTACRREDGNWILID